MCSECLVLNTYVPCKAHFPARVEVCTEPSSSGSKHGAQRTSASPTKCLLSAVCACGRPHGAGTLLTPQPHQRAASLSEPYALPSLTLLSALCPSFLAPCPPLCPALCHALVVPLLPRPCLPLPSSSSLRSAPTRCSLLVTGRRSRGCSSPRCSCGTICRTITCPLPAIQSSSR